MVLAVDEFLKLRASLPLADVRSEKEFGDGHIRHAVNIPILNNEERRLVGIDYKEKGQATAIMTGFRLVGPRFHEIIRQAEELANGKELLVHCWRGGMRSANFCKIIGMANVKTIQLQGGYKSYREKALEFFKLPMNLRIVGGLTGSGKGDILRALREKGEQVIDLEHLAAHRGSAFGALKMPPQPTTEQFQNDLFEELMTFDLTRPIWIEDESVAIGKIFLPLDFWRQMSASPVYDVSASDKGARIERLVREYGDADRTEFLAAMQCITKKLGGQNFKAAKEKLEAGDMASTIDILLTYYDKAYRAGLEKKKGRIVAKVEWSGRDIAQCVDTLLSNY